MKKLILLFSFISFLTYGNSNLNKDNEIFKKLNNEKEIETLTSTQKEKLLNLRKEYFSELKEIQIRFKNLRKEANHYMLNNDEKGYEEIHDKMNELKFEREYLKENYRKKIAEILE